MALQKQTIHYPLAMGVNTKADPRAMEAPSLAVCQNAEFDEIGGLQTRPPFASIASDGGASISDIRRLAVYGDELIAFTKDKIYSYATDGTWYEKADHLAVKVDEQSVLTAEGEQQDCDRAEHGNVVMYSWIEYGSATTAYIAALDKTTGTVLLAPQEIRASAVDPRLIATTNKIILCYFVSTAFYCRAYDPSDLTKVENTSTYSGLVAFDLALDIQTPTQGVIVASRGASLYTLANVTESGTITNATNKTLTSSRNVGLAVSPDGDVAVIRATGSAVRYADIMNSSFVDVSVDNSLMTGLLSVQSNNTACAFRSVQDSGAYRCYVFCTEGSNENATEFRTTMNWINDAGSMGTQATFGQRLAVASRAFDHDGSVCVWLSFGQVSTVTGNQVLGLRVALQNTYYLYRDDGLLIAKSCTDVGGGHASDWFLPNVQSLGSNQYAWCGVERRTITLGNSGGGGGGYAARSPREVIFEFDHDDARRTARLGKTLYVAGGQILQYDGDSLFELGFHVYPWYIAATINGAGSLAAGEYSYKGTLRAENAKGELDRCTTATNDGLTSAGTEQGLVTIIPLSVTRRAGRNVPAIEIWRTQVDPTTTAPFYLVTGKDPAVQSGDNAYIENDPTATTQTLDDDATDAEIAVWETNPENVGVLENLAPPAASIIAATQDRLFLAGIPGKPYRLVYSKLRNPGEVVSFHDALTVDLPPDGGAITALAWLSENLIVFKERAIYALAGDGFDNTGGGQNYGPARVVASDVGAVSADTIALAPMGIVFFSDKGWQLFDKGWAVQYIGAAVAGFDTDTFHSVVVIEDQHQVRCMSTSRCLVWDYSVGSGMGEWSEWTISGALHSVIYDNLHHYVLDTVDGTDNDIWKQADWQTDESPRSWLDSAHGSGASSYSVDPGVSAWPATGNVRASEGLAVEEDMAYTSISGPGDVIITLDGTTSNAHASGAMVRLLEQTLLDGGEAAGSTSLVVDATTMLPESGYLILSEGLAAEEIVAYDGTETTSITLAGATVNTHADNATVRLVSPSKHALDVETAWIKLAGLQGFKRIRRFAILGEYRGPHALRIRVAYDYEEDDASGVTWVDDKTWTPSPTTIGGPLQARHGPSRGRCEAIKIRITALHTSGSGAPLGEALRLTGLSLSVGLKPGTFKSLPAAQKQ